MAKPKQEKHEFQSEVKQLLNILVYSLYQHKEVFLRELISNAVDALNKVQFEVLTDSPIEDPELDLNINISFGKTQNKLVIEDTGIGMTEKELIQNIGTIARSGAMEFIQKIADSPEKEKVEMIGKFGVGFYASFMVAKEIHIYTKSARKGSRGYLWKSKGDNNYTIEETDRKTRGTRIELFLKKEEKEFLEKFRIQNIISSHSKFVPFPIYLEKEKIESIDAIWTQPKSSLKEKDYQEFFKFFENSQEDPEIYLHLSSDAPVQFNAVIYIPKTSIELLGLMKSEPGVDLYSKKVLIQKGSKDLLPEYMRFIKGIIDSEDIPLNISRETIQNNIIIEKIRKHVLKKIFDELNKLKKKDPEKYLNIWKNFNRNIKEGIISDYENRDKLSPLLMFDSSRQKDGKLTDLAGYIERMGKDQKEIVYVAGLNRESLEKNPALEAFKKKDIEVLYLTDPMDEFVMDHLKNFEGKPLKIAESAEIKLEDKEPEEKDKKELKDAENLVTYLKTVFGDKVADVKISERLVESPCMMVHPTDGPSVQMEKIMKMANQNYQFAKKIFEINPKNQLIKELIRIHQAQPDSEPLKNLCLQLLDNMMLREGVIENIDSVIPRINDIMLMATKNI